MSVALAVDNLTCIRGHRVVFERINLAVASGGFVAIQGANGSGKTSLLRIVAGLLRPASGLVTLKCGSLTSREPEDRATLVGWLGHQDAVKPQLTVREQILFWGALYGSGRDPGEAMAAFGIARMANVPGQFLSAGQRRRLALVRLTLMNRPIWLLDEPLAALDGEGKAFVLKALKDHCAQGGIVLAATHEPLGFSGETLRLGAPS